MPVFSKSKIERIQSRQTEKKHTILIVDDEMANLRALESLLNRHYTVLTAANGVAALQAIQGDWQGREIHLIISDHRMPEMSGIVFLQEVRDLLPRSIRILLTAFKDVQVILESINRAQIFKYILKPYDRDDLLITIERALELYDTQLELERYRLSLEEQVAQRTRALVHQAKYSALGSMILGMADRLRNPLNFVDGLSRVSLELLEEWRRETGGQDTEPMVQQIEENLAMILKHGGRLNAMVEGMMRLSREDVTTSQEAVELGGLLTEHADLACHKLHALDPHFEVVMTSSFDPRCAIIEVEVQSFSRALNAIFSNAVESMQDKIATAPDYAPELTVRTLLSAESVIVLIRDNGMGATAEALPRLCEHFFTSKSSERGHVGLGLTMASDFIRSQGGDLRFTSQPGEFFEVAVHFPLKVLELTSP